KRTPSVLGDLIHVRSSVNQNPHRIQVALTRRKDQRGQASTVLPRIVVKTKIGRLILLRGLSPISALAAARRTAIFLACSGHRRRREISGASFGRKAGARADVGPMLDQ